MHNSWSVLYTEMLRTPSSRSSKQPQSSAQEELPGECSCGHEESAGSAGAGIKLVSHFSKTYCRIEAQDPRELWPVDWVKTPLLTSERSQISLSPNRQTQTHFRWGFDVSDPVQANQKFSGMTSPSKSNLISSKGTFTCSPLCLILLEPRTKQKISTWGKQQQQHHKTFQSFRVHLQVPISKPSSLLPSRHSLDTQLQSQFRPADKFTVVP